MIKAASQKLVRWVKVARATAHRHPVDAFPVLRGWKGYDLPGLVADLRAGASLALLTVPQCMAYALVAGLPVIHGIMAGAIAALVAGFLCGSRHISVGPATATAFTTFSFFAAYPELGARQVELMPLLCLMVGLILTLGAVFRFGELVQYISRAVMVGYLTGAAILIMVNQVKDVLAVSLAFPDGGLPRTLPSMIMRLVEVVPESSWAAMITAATTLGLYAAMRKWLPGWPAFVLALALVAGVSALLGQWTQAFQDLPRVAGWQASDLALRLPEFGSRWFEDVSMLFGLAAALAFIISLETTVTGKGMAAKARTPSPPDQDLYGVGVANLAAAFAQGMPSSTSLTRSAMAVTLGIRSRLGMIFNGLFCLALAFGLAAFVEMIPRAALAALVIAMACKLFNFRQFAICLRATRSDAATLVATLIATLIVPLYIAVFAGVAVSIILYLRKAAHPELVEYAFNEEGALAETKDRNIPAISIVHVEGDLFFGAADLFRNQIQQTMRDSNLRVIILRLRNARNLDATSVLALDELLTAVLRDNRHLLISGVTKNVYSVLLNSGMVERLGRDNLFVHSPGNPNLSTRNALIRAQELLGTKEADIQIFVDRTKRKKQEKTSRS